MYDFLYASPVLREVFHILRMFYDPLNIILHLSHLYSKKIPQQHNRHFQILKKKKKKENSTLV